MSPSIRSFVSELCQERRGGREDDWETARVTGRDTAWVWEILKKRTCKCRHKAKKDRQTENGWETVYICENGLQIGFDLEKKKLKKGQRFSANLILVPHSCEEDIKKGWLQKVDSPIVFAKAFE